MSSNIQGNSSDECGECQHTQNNNLQLPADCYAKILDYASFDTVLACGATCRTILHDAMPLLSKISIDRSSQMNLVIASRFRDIKEIHIKSLFELTIEEEGTDEEYKDMSINFDTKTSIVPFLAKFDSLERVVFGIKDNDGNDIDGISPADCHFYEGDDRYPYEGDRESLLAVLDMLSGAFRCGGLQKNLQIRGLCCPDTTDKNGMRGNNCSICTRACKHFPLESVVEFECRGTSSSNAKSSRCHGLDVCLDRAKIESLLESRPGGKDMLRSDKRLLYLLGRGRRYIIPSNDDGEQDVQRALHIVKYKQEELNEIKRVINYAALDVKKLSIESVSNAIRQSFAMNNGTTPSADQCYIAESSLSYLINKFGLPINKEDLERPLTDLIKHTHHIVSVLTHRYNDDYSSDDDSDSDDEEDERKYEDIELDCLRLVRRLLEVESNPPIQQMTKAIPTLINRLEKGSDEYKVEVVTSLRHILTKGTTEQHKMIVDEGAITKLSRLLDSTNESIVTAALLSLKDISTKGTADDIEEMGRTCTIDSLVKLLASNDDDSVKSSLGLLTAVKGHIKDRTHKSLLPHLARIMKLGTTAESDMLANCLVLLCKVLETDHGPTIEAVAELKMTPTLLDMIKTSDNNTANKTNLLHSLFNLARTKNLNSRTGVILEEKDFLSILVSLVDSPDNNISEGAMTAVGAVANASISCRKNKAVLAKGKPIDEYIRYRDLLLQEGIMEPLLRMIENSASVDILRVASWTLKQLCRGKPFDHAISNSCLKILARALDIDTTNTETLCSICWTLNHILIGFDEMDTQVTEKGFLAPLLKRLPSLPHHVQLPALKSLHLISSACDELVQSIINADGVDYISKALHSPLVANQELACNTISNILAKNTDRVLEDSTVSGMLKMIAFGQTQATALQAICNITESATATQIRNLIVQEDGCIRHLCDMLTSDSNTAKSGLQALANIFKVGRKDILRLQQQTLFGTTVLSDNVPEIETKLNKLMNEVQQSEQQAKCIQLLEQKKKWLDFHSQNEHIESFTNAIELLKRQEKETTASFESIKDKITSVKGDETKKCFEKQISIAEKELSLAQEKLDVLKEEAEKGAPLKEWNEKAKDNLSAELELVSNALEGANSKLESITSARADPDRKKEVDKLGTDIQKLFLQDTSGKENNLPNLRKNGSRGKAKKLLSKRRAMRKLPLPPHV